MIISRNWLQRYFKDELPSADDIAETLLLHSFEIEEVVKKGDDQIIDIDVLPNRAHDCLSHYGIAKELSFLLNIPIVPDVYDRESFEQLPQLNIHISSDDCRRYTAIRIEGIDATKVPDYVNNLLVSLGQTTKNTIVDIGNYIMFDTGQPVHIFDADCIEGGISVRKAKEGETMDSLSGDLLTLEPHQLVIADDTSVLALAGVKGSTKAQVTEYTKNIIIEVAHFDPLSIRTSSKTAKIQTDASKRYENDPSCEIASRALSMIHSLITTTCGGTCTGYYDHYPDKEITTTIDCDINLIENVLGVAIPTATISDMLNRYGLETRIKDGVASVTIPPERKDLSIPQDLIEEIGRLYGYHHIPSKAITDIQSEPQVDPLTYTRNVITNTCIEHGFNEVMNYSFVKKGEVSVYNPLAKDKGYLRSSLQRALQEACDHNAKYAALLAKDRIALFEIGKVYSYDQEIFQCALAVCNIDKKARKKYGDEKEQLEQLLQILWDTLGVTDTPPCTWDTNSVSFDLSSLAQTIELPSTYGDVFSIQSYAHDTQQKTISMYPFSTRDVSLWVDEDTDREQVSQCIVNHAGLYLQKHYCFDTFTKDGRTSYAFTLVFQAEDRTLEEDDIETAMTAVVNAFENNNWELR
jgi:phenylalanyl-tRNA synthetase beta chain